MMLSYQPLIGIIPFCFNACICTYIHASTIKIILVYSQTEAYTYIKLFCLLYLFNTGLTNISPFLLPDFTCCIFCKREQEMLTLFWLHCLSVWIVNHYSYVWFSLICHVVDVYRNNDSSQPHKLIKRVPNVKLFPLCMRVDFYIKLISKKRWVQSCMPQDELWLLWRRW